MVSILTGKRPHLQRVKYFVATLAVVFLPLTSSLAVAADPAPTCTAPPDSTYGSGIHHPVGADASLYTYNCDTGLWESSHYTYDPATGIYTSKDPAVYTYNPSTGGYDYTTWVYNAPANNYVAVSSSTATPPAGATVVGGPVTNSISNTGPGSNNSINNNGGGTSSIGDTGPDSNNAIDNSDTNNLNANNTTGATLATTLTADATTGNAMVLGNTVGGSAASGDATDVANVMNLLQSTSNALGGNAVTFVANINGDVNGDLMLDPSVLSSVQPASNGSNNTTINNSANASMTNNINLNAASGDATTANNTTAGDATTGAAKTIANVVNLINSAVTSGRSFLGVININGNLNGDILMPPDFINQLLAANVPTVNIVANTGPSSNNTINAQAGSNTDITNTNNEGITNNIDATATSGSANVSGNTGAGNATSGNTATHITAFNLTGSSLIGSNDMLVFVNVVGGKWVGLIVNAPPGATAAELGGGITSSGGGGNNNTNITNNANESITNNINLASRSGNASVQNNTSAGNAHSGDADAAVNLLNVENSTLTLSNWFGILFINVFGTWNGSFGINTAAGDPIWGGGTVPSSFANASSFAAFAPHPAAGTSNAPNYFASVNSGNSGSSNASADTPTLTAAKVKINKPAQREPILASGHVNWVLVATSVSLFAAYIVGERLYAIRQAR